MALGRLLLPPRCLLCGAAGEAGLDLCRDCRVALPWQRSACARCALPLAEAATLCGACQRKPPGFDAAWAAFAYAPPLDRLLPRFKFHADLAAGALLSRLMAEAPPPVAVDALLPVPLHRGRLRERGFNQAMELARPLARGLGLPLGPDLLRRVRATPAQTTLDGAARRRNLREAFVAPGPVPARVRLIDDVRTTGTTLAASSEALKRAGAQWVGCWVAARVDVP